MSPENILMYFQNPDEALTRFTVDKESLGKWVRRVIVYPYPLIELFNGNRTHYLYSDILPAALCGKSFSQAICFTQAESSEDLPLMLRVAFMNSPKMLLYFKNADKYEYFGEY